MLLCCAAALLADPGRVVAMPESESELSHRLVRVGQPGDPDQLVRPPGGGGGAGGEAESADAVGSVERDDEPWNEF